MRLKTVFQPPTTLGSVLDALFASQQGYEQIVVATAWVSLRALIRVRDRVLYHVARGARVRVLVGIDLLGTSKEALEELLAWPIEVFVCHNASVGAVFHPKVYFFQSLTSSTLIVGSNNLTDGGLYSNFEAAILVEFARPADEESLEEARQGLGFVVGPPQPPSLRLDRALLDALVARGVVPTEAEAMLIRQKRGRPSQPHPVVPPNPFPALPVLRAPLLPARLRAAESASTAATAGQGPGLPAMAAPVAQQTVAPGSVVWRKVLSATDAQVVGPGTNPVGGIRLTQAGFIGSDGEVIDQTKYFRNLFSNQTWEPEPGGHPDQELARVPMRVRLLGADSGVQELEVSHKPSGEAGQGNYTTILRLGPDLMREFQRLQLAGATLTLYENDSETEPFLVEVSR